MDQPVVIDCRERYLSRALHLWDHDGSIRTRDLPRVGMIAAGLEIETHARIAERFGGTLLDESIKSHVASALRDVLTRLGIANDVLIEYDRQVSELARERALSSSASPPDASQPTTAYVADPDDEDLHSAASWQPADQLSIWPQHAGLSSLPTADSDQTPGALHAEIESAIEEAAQDEI